MEENNDPGGPDFAAGVSLATIVPGKTLLGHAAGEPILVTRNGDDYFAISATCTHYGGPLAEGVMADETVRCPWHHACFSLRTGEALRPPALAPLISWKVELHDNKLFVRDRKTPELTRTNGSARLPEKIIIVGGGGAGNAAAEMLRREGYGGGIMLISADDSIPYDRPALSKDFLEGEVGAESLPLLSMDFYRKHAIELLLNKRVADVNPQNRTIELDDGRQHEFDALLLATGAEPVRLEVPGASRSHVKYLRTQADCRAILASAHEARSAVVVGASFIAMEVAAGLIKRNLKVNIVAPEEVPMSAVLGTEIGGFLRRLHESKGVIFHLQQEVIAIGGNRVTLKNGQVLAADLVVVGIGVKPCIELAERVGLKIDRGVAVNAYLETSHPGIFAAGDIARWPDAHTKENIRVEHWVVAERQGQTAARNMLGRRERFDAVPFFWTRQFDFTLHYIGHAEKWDQVDLEGSLEDYDCKLAFRRAGKTLAIATVGRDVAGLESELAMERGLIND
jgi:apoptosis-inducing factor 3